MVTWYSPVDLPLCISFASATSSSSTCTGFIKLIEVSNATDKLFRLLQAKANALSAIENFFSYLHLNLTVSFFYFKDLNSEPMAEKIILHHLFNHFFS